MNPFSELQAQDVMNAPVLTTSSNADIEHVEQDFVRHGVSAMPVVQNDQIVGVISRSDLMLVPVLTAAIESSTATAGVADHSSETTFRVGDLMKRRVVQCAPETPLGMIAADMVHHHVHHVVVVRDDKPIGIVSSLDIVQLTAE